MEQPRTTSRDFFLYLAVLVTLYVSVISLINLLFGTIDYAFPDALMSYYDPYSTTIRWTIASLVVMFPVFGFLSHLVEKGVEKNSQLRELSVRKWFIFLTLFLTGTAMAVDLIALVNTFLGGEITTRFVLKVAALLIVTGFTFVYYFLDLRGKIHARAPRVWFVVAALVVLVSIIGGFMIMGSPATARMKRFDERRVQDLQSIQWQVVNFWQQKGRLPTSLSDISDPISGFVVPIDPETGKEYLYKVVSGVGAKPIFNLCATFNLPSTVGLSDKGRMPVLIQPSPVGGMNENTSHRAGEDCLTRTIDPELYPSKKPL